MFDRGQLHGALQVLEEIGGALAVSADEEVIGALGDATAQYMDDDESLIEQTTGALVGPVDLRGRLSVPPRRASHAWQQH